MWGRGSHGFDVGSGGSYTFDLGLLGQYSRVVPTSSVWGPATVDDGRRPGRTSRTSRSHTLTEGTGVEESDDTTPPETVKEDGRLGVEGGRTGVTGWEIQLVL